MKTPETSTPQAEAGASIESAKAWLRVALRDLDRGDRVDALGSIRLAEGKIRESLADTYGNPSASLTDEQLAEGNLTEDRR